MSEKPASDGTRRFEAAYWIFLGRAPTSRELRDGARDDPRLLLLRLLASTEFHELRRRWTAGPDPQPARERAFGAFGSDEAFVEQAYEWLLGRPADPGGRAHYVDTLRAGGAREEVVRALACSEEFERRLHDALPEHGTIPVDTQLCELANPAKWDNPEWLEILRSFGLSDEKRVMHRKPYEFAQLVFGCRRLGALTPEARIVSVGAGHEHALYWLANHAGSVVATDLYAGVWQEVQGREGDPDVIRRPEDFAPFPYRRDRLTFLPMDGRRLGLADGTFDIAYSLSSIEHFGIMDGARATMAEMARVLKPGGILALATEYVLAGPPHEETFLPGQFAELINIPGLRIVQPFDDRVWDRYEYRAIDLYRNPYQSPHMVVRFDDTVFTTAMVFLRKEA
jgi:SAM-dependent methyltransferase